MPFLTRLSVDCQDEGYPFSIPAIRGLEGGIELHPKVTRRFMRDPRGMVEKLLEDE